MDRRKKYPADKGRVSMKNGMVKYDNRGGDAAQAIQLMIAGGSCHGFDFDRAFDQPVP